MQLGKQRRVDGAVTLNLAATAELHAAPGNGATKPVPTSFKLKATACVVNWLTFG